MRAVVERTMSIAVAVATILSATVPLVVALVGLTWWAYKRGVAAGEACARREAVERSQVEDKAKIEALERILDRNQGRACFTAAQAKALATTGGPRRARHERHGLPCVGVEAVRRLPIKQQGGRPAGGQRTMLKHGITKERPALSIRTRSRWLKIGRCSDCAPSAALISEPLADGIGGLA
jgi:hypothetical protein